MDKQYYYIDPQGARQGPLPLSSIPREQITPTTKVWCKGMDTWEEAYKVTDFAPLLAQPIITEPQPSAPGTPQPPQPPTPPQSYQAYQAPTPPRPQQAPYAKSGDSKKALYISLGVVGGLILILLIAGAIFFIFSKKGHRTSDAAEFDSVSVDSTVVDSAAVDTTADYDDTYDYTDSLNNNRYDDEGGSYDNVLEGYMTDETGDNPIRLEFTENSDGTLTDCIYTNVALGGKIRMQGTATANSYTFSGKDGRNDFIIHVESEVGSTGYTGYARDGSKRLEVVLK